MVTIPSFDSTNRKLNLIVEFHGMSAFVIIASTAIQNRNDEIKELLK